MERTQQIAAVVMASDFKAHVSKQEKDRRKETISESSDGCLVSV